MVVVAGVGSDVSVSNGSLGDAVMVSMGANDVVLEDESGNDVVIVETVQ